MRLCLQVLGWSALAGGVYLWTQLNGLNGPSSFLFEGGYFLFGLGVALVIFCAITAQTASLSQALGNPVFRYVGKISYGTYLWHFPLFALLDSARMHLYGYPLLAVRIGVTLVVATASFYLVEEPIRRGRMRSLTEWKAWLMTSAACLGVVAITVAATLPSTAEAAGAVRMVGAEYSGPPVKVAIFGDSVAWRLGFAMLASQPQNNYDVNIYNGAIVGCGVLRSSEYMAHGVPDPMISQCNTSTPKSGQWPALWMGDLKQFRPNVVVMLAGRWELDDRLIDGRWLHIGEPGLRRRSPVFTRAGRRCGHVDRSPDGDDDLAVLRLWRTGQRSAMARGLGHPTGRVQRHGPTGGRATSGNGQDGFDFDALMCPGGQFTTSFNGIQIRDGDGVHIVPTAAAGQWLDARVLPDGHQGGPTADGRRQATTPSSSTIPSSTPRVSSSASARSAGTSRGP